MTQEIAVREQPGELSLTDLTAQVRKIQEVMAAVMKKGEHYGVIPGTDKPTLLKPGAEKLCLTFRLDPEYDTKEIQDGEHLTVISKCTLYHITSGNRMGSGMGSCSTKESRYAYRKGSRHCPKCQKETIIKGKAEFGGGWLCFAKKGGCGAKFKDGDATIEAQSVERVTNEDKADQYNTVLKMANKRSLVAAVLVVTAASDIFTQDIEDLPDVGADAAVRTERGGEQQTERREPGGAPPQNDGSTITQPQQKRFFAIAKGRADLADVKQWLKDTWGYKSTTDIKRADYEQITLRLQDPRPLLEPDPPPDSFDEAEVGELG